MTYSTRQSNSKIFLFHMMAGNSETKNLSSEWKSQKQLSLTPWQDAYRNKKALKTWVNTKQESVITDA